MGKNGNGTMTVSMIKMYEQMIEDDFDPIIKILQARGNAVKDTVIVDVKKDLGVYDLLTRKAKLELELAEVKEQIERKTKAVRVPDATSWEYKSPIDLEVERRMEEINAPLTEAKRFRDGLMREIKLSTGTPEVRAVFGKLPAEIEEWKTKVTRLPKIKVRRLTDEELLVVKG